MGPRFNVSSADNRVIGEIAERAIDTLPWTGQVPTLMEIMMDITATHANGCPLRLVELKEADLTNFAHDIGGIRRHLNRQTGKLEDCFSPRYSDHSD